MDALANRIRSTSSLFRTTLLPTCISKLSRIGWVESNSSNTNSKVQTSYIPPLFHLFTSLYPFFSSNPLQYLPTTLRVSHWHNSNSFWHNLFMYVVPTYWSFLVCRTLIGLLGRFRQNFENYFSNLFGLEFRLNFSPAFECR